MGQIAIPVSGGGTELPVLFSKSGCGAIANYDRTAILYSDNGTYRNLLYTTSAITVSGTDFSGTLQLNSNTTLTVKKAGKYQINNNGNISTVTLTAGQSVSVPYHYAHSQYWYIVKI